MLWLVGSPAMIYSKIQPRGRVATSIPPRWQYPRFSTISRAHVSPETVSVSTFPSKMWKSNRCHRQTCPIPAFRCCVSEEVVDDIHQVQFVRDELRNSSKFCRRNSLGCGKVKGNRHSAWRRSPHSHAQCVGRVCGVKRTSKRHLTQATLLPAGSETPAGGGVSWLGTPGRLWFPRLD